MMNDKLKVDSRLISLEELNSHEEISTKRSRSEETSPKSLEEENIIHVKQPIKKKAARRNSMDRFVTRGLQKNSEEKLNTEVKEQSQTEKEEREGKAEGEGKGEEQP